MAFMPWKKIEPMEERIEFGLKAMRTLNFRALCQEYGISTKTGYKWKERFVREGIAGMSEQSRRPKSSPDRLEEEALPPVLGREDAGGGDGRERREERAYVRQGIRADPDPLPIHELLRELALRPHGRERVGREKRIATQVLVVARTVEQREERQVLEPRARGERIGRGDELVNERRHVAHGRTPRRFADRCVSFTCSGPRSSGGVR